MSSESVCPDRLWVWTSFLSATVTAASCSTEGWVKHAHTQLMGLHFWSWLLNTAQIKMSIKEINRFNKDKFSYARW